ncbi:MAG: beta strand repeat-containing protein, partial [Acidobacteriota bacterium]
METIVTRGTCASCLTDEAVVDSLTIDTSGQIAAEAIKSGVLQIRIGGTGLTDYKTGDLLFASNANVLDALEIGTANGQILQIVNGLPAWSSLSLTAPGSNATTSGANLVGVFNNFTNSSATNLQQVLQDLDASITSAGTSPLSVANDSTSGDYIYPTTSSYDFVLGGSGTPNTSSLFFNATTANLALGINNTGSGGLDGSIRLNSSGVGITDPTISTNASGDLLIPNGNIGVGITTPSGVFRLEVNGHIGPTGDGIYDLGSATHRFRNIYLSGTTTSDGDITIANIDPSLRIEDISPGEDTFAINVDGSTFTLLNESQSRSELVINTQGDFALAGGSGATGCTIINANGNISCSGTGTFGSTLIASNGLTLTTGALNLTATSGALTLSGLGASSIDTGANNLTISAANFSTTATGINASAIGATTPATGAFTTLAATNNTTLAGDLTVNGSTTIGDTSADTLGVTANSTFLNGVSLQPSGTSDIVFATDADSTIQITGLQTPVGTATTLCLEAGTNNVVNCPSSASTLQTAYEGGNTITTIDARDLDFTLADTATNSNFDIDIAGGNTVSISRNDNASAE